MKLGKIVRCFIYLAVSSLPSGVTLAWLHLVARPCLPGHFAYFMYTSCSDPETEWKLTPDWILRLLIPTGMMWIFLHGLTCLIFEGAIYTTLHCFCLINYQYLFWRKCQFHRETLAAVQMYKEIQLLTAYYNQIHGSVLSVSFTVSVSSNFIISFFAAVGLYSEMMWPIVLLYASIAFNTMIEIMVCDGGTKATVNTVSTRILSKVRAAPNFRMSRDVKRYVVSMPVLKIRLGSTNFYDKETPLNLIDFCVGQVVNLLLL